MSSPTFGPATSLTHATTWQDNDAVLAEVPATFGRFNVRSAHVMQGNGTAVDGFALEANGETIHAYRLPGMNADVYHEAQHLHECARHSLNNFNRGIHPTSQREFVAYIRTILDDDIPNVTDAVTGERRPMTPAERNAEATRRANGSEHTLRYAAAFQNTRRQIYPELPSVSYAEGNLMNANLLENARQNVEHADAFILEYKEVSDEAPNGANHDVTIMRLDDGQFHVLDSRMEHIEEASRSCMAARPIYLAAVHVRMV